MVFEKGLVELSKLFRNAKPQFFKTADFFSAIYRKKPLWLCKNSKFNKKLLKVDNYLYF